MSDFKVAWAIPTWNGARLNQTLLTLPPREHREVISTKERGWALAKAWNYAATKYLREQDYDVVILANDDILVRESTGQDLARGLLVDQFDPTQRNLGADPAGQLLLVTAYNLNHGHPDVGCRWGVGAPDYSCFAISRQYLDVVGPFDENFHPCYFEDNDSHRRIRLAGYEGAQWTPYFHYGSTTIDTDPERQAELQGNGGKFERNRQYYCRKWGGPPHHETFEKPFNGRAA